MKHHKDLTPERWFQFSILEQLGNVGSDVERAIRWRNKGDLESSHCALECALELLDLTIEDPKNQSERQLELTLVRKFLIDFFRGNNQYAFTDEYWQNYFDFFALASAVSKGK